MTIPSSKPEGEKKETVEQHICCIHCGKNEHYPHTRGCIPLVKPTSPASTEVKCKNRYCASNTAFSQFGCTCPSPASTEDWENEFDEKFPQASFTPPKEANLGDSILITVGRAESKKAFIRSLLSSHDQQLRQRIDKELFEELAMDDPECEHGHFWQDCTAKKCDKRSMALLYKHLATFITNLK